MTIGSWLAGKLSDPEFEAWIDERIAAATKVAALEALAHLDEQAIAVAVTDRIFDRLGGAFSEVTDMVDKIDGRVDEVVDLFAAIPAQLAQQAPAFALEFMRQLVGAGQAAGAGRLTLGGLFDNLLAGRLPFGQEPEAPR